MRFVVYLPYALSEASEFNFIYQSKSLCIASSATVTNFPSCLEESWMLLRVRLL